MKNYTITVNGNVYEVTVEEGTGAAVSAPAVAPKAAPAKKAAPKAAATGAQGSVQINAPMQGKITGIKVNAGDSVKKGQVVLTFEAMKMENEIVSPQDGVVASINVAVGDAIESGALVATLK